IETRRQINDNSHPNENVNGHTTYLSSCPTSSKPNVEPLTDITNIGHVSRQTLDTLRLSTDVVSSNMNSYQTHQVRRGRGHPRLGTQHSTFIINTSVTPNVQPLTDIANIGHVSSQNRRQTLDTLLLTQFMASNLNSYQTPQVRRCRGSPRLGTQASSSNTNTTVTQPRRRGRPPYRVDSPSVSRNVRQHINHDVRNVDTLPPRSNIVATTSGGKINKEINNSGAPYTFQLKGQNHHKIGTLLPTHEEGRPRFAQLYIFDTLNEVENCLYALNRRLTSSSEDVMLQMLAFRMARDRVSVASIQPFTLRLIGTRQRNARQYNLPTASEVAALVPGDGNPMDSQDVVVEERGGEEGRTSVKRISELHPSFMA
nr:hypothetical protein [Tanacetum cinerariifolium]